MAIKKGVYMDKVEPANKLHKLNRSGKKNSPSIENKGKTSETAKKSADLPSGPDSPDKTNISKKFTAIRLDLVSKYKKEIRQGTYRVKTDEIAEKVIQKYKEQIYYKPFV